MKEKIYQAMRKKYPYAHHMKNMSGDIEITSKPGKENIYIIEYRALTESIIASYRIHSAIEARFILLIFIDITNNQLALSFLSDLIHQNSALSIEVIYFVSHGELILTTQIQHKQQNTASFITYKGILYNHAVVELKMHTHIMKKATKAHALQKIIGIVESDAVSITTSPILEALCDDIAASHGCYIGQIDQELLLYLMSKGFSSDQAKQQVTLSLLRSSLSHSCNCKLDKIRPYYSCSNAG